MSTLNVTNISDTLHLDSTNNRVGIGTNSPTAALEVHGSNQSNNLIVGHSNTDFSVYTDNNSGEVRLKAEDGSGNNFAKFMTFYTHANGSAAAERMRIDAAGTVRTPYQPACTANTGAAWFNMQSGNAYGIGPSLPLNRGGFYLGGSLGGFQVVHVPATGLYRCTLNIYLASNQGGRIVLKRNNATDICFIQTVVTNADTIQHTQGLIEMNANDYLNYYMSNTLNTYHANHHTYVTVEYMG